MAKDERLVTIAYRLLALHVSGARVTELMNTFPPDRIERQLDWLPFRNATRPEAMIVEAIRKDYSAPKEAYAKNQTHSSHTRRSVDKGAQSSPRHAHAESQGYGTQDRSDSTSPIERLGSTQSGINLVVPEA